MLIGRDKSCQPVLDRAPGFSHTELLGRKLWEIGPLKDALLSKASFRELQEKEHIRYEHLPLETRDGRQIDVEFVSNVYRVNHQKVIQCNIRDITKRKRAEEADAYLASIVESSDDAIIGKSPEGIIRSWNRGAERLYGYTASEVIGQSIMLFVPPEFREEVCGSPDTY